MNFSPQREEGNPGTKKYSRRGLGDAQHETCCLHPHRNTSKSKKTTTYCCVSQTLGVRDYKWQWTSAGQSGLPTLPQIRSRCQHFINRDRDGRDMTQSHLTFKCLMGCAWPGTTSHYHFGTWGYNIMSHAAVCKIEPVFPSLAGLKAGGRADLGPSPPHRMSLVPA